MNHEPPAEPSERATPPLRILIADDHFFFRRGLCEVINEEHDLQVVGEAADGQEAIQKVRDLRPDLVLMDIGMPRLDGISATRRICAEDPGLAVVMLTVSTTDSDLFEAVKAGAVGFLTKGLSPDALLRALRDFHSGKALPMSRAVAAKVLAYFRQGAAAAQAGTPPDLSLTPREREVLELVASGARDREIAHLLGIAETTVKKHVQNVLQKLQVRSRTQAVVRVERSKRVES